MYITANISTKPFYALYAFYDSSMLLDWMPLLGQQGSLQGQVFVVERNILYYFNTVSL